MVRIDLPRKLGSAALIMATVPTGSDSWRQYRWWSKYSSMNEEEVEAVDRNWDQVVPAHGIVAVDHSWAAEHRLPASMDLPSDHSKGVYIIDAYHQLHCLTVLRKTFYQVIRNEPLTYPLGHSTHCFDSLRQYTMCTGGDTLLYTWGRNITGDGQARKCRNWSALRDWAAENTACYSDTPHDIPLLDHFGHCDNGTDGLFVDE